MKIDVDTHSSVVVAQVSGELDLADGTAFTDELLGKIPDDLFALVVDLGDLRYIDSAGVRALFAIASALKMRDQKLALVLPESSPLRSVLKITRVEDVAVIAATCEDASQLVADQHPGA